MTTKSRTEMPGLQTVRRKGGGGKKEENKTTYQERKGINHLTTTCILMPGRWEINRLSQKQLFKEETVEDFTETQQGKSQERNANTKK